MNDSELDLSRIASGIERIADAVDPRPPASPLLVAEVEVDSSKTEAERVQGELEKCVTYAVSSVDPDPPKFISMSIRFLLKDDPKWRAGQRIKVTVA